MPSPWKHLDIGSIGDSDGKILEIAIRASQKHTVSIETPYLMKKEKFSGSGYGRDIDHTLYDRGA